MVFLNYRKEDEEPLEIASNCEDPAITTGGDPTCSISSDPDHSKSHDPNHIEETNPLNSNKKEQE